MGFFDIALSSLRKILPTSPSADSYSRPHRPELVTWPLQANQQQARMRLPSLPQPIMMNYLGLGTLPPQQILGVYPSEGARTFCNHKFPWLTTKVYFKFTWHCLLWIGCNSTLVSLPWHPGCCIMEHGMWMEPEHGWSHGWGNREQDKPQAGSMASAQKWHAWSPFTFH